MSRDTAPDKDQIREQMYKAADWNARGETDVSAMSYEEGVEAALRWVLDGEDPPIENNAPEDEDDEEEDYASGEDPSDEE